MALGNPLEALVVIGVASACVLDAVDMAIVMHHLVEQRCTDVFNVPCEWTGRDMPIRSWRGLNGDGRSL